MRPILSWLAILDQRILERVMRLAPEVLFEGGDPAQLLLETRIQILRGSCEQLAQPAHGRSITEYSAVQRFTNPDLADVIRELLEKHKDNDDIVWFLVRMVQQGGIAARADKAKHFALTSRSKYTRIAAIRAIVEVGTPEDVADVQMAYVAEPPPLRRDWLAELLDGLGNVPSDVDWLLLALTATEPKKQFETDPLADALSKYVASLAPSLLAALLEGISKL